MRVIYTIFCSLIIGASLAQTVGNNTTPTQPDSSLFNQVDFQEDQINTGYTKIAKKNFTGAVSLIKESEIPGMPYTSLDQLLQGRAAGILVTQASGQPAGEMIVRVRGTQSPAAGNEPLYVIDGFPLYNDNAGASAGFTLGPRLNALAMFNPADVESVTVLKDAAAQAIYGSRGANGVVLIDTKRGKEGVPKIEFHAYGGFQEAIGKYDLLNASRYAEYMNEANINAGLDQVYDNPASFGEGTDWQEEMLRSSAYIQNYQVNFQGGSRGVTFLISGAFTTRAGLLKDSRFDRANLHANIDAEVSDKFSVRNSLNISRVEANTIPTDDPGDASGNGMISGAYLFSPALNVKNEEGNYTILSQSEFAALSPVALAAFTESEAKNFRLVDYLTVDYELCDHLTFSLSAGVDALFNEEVSFISGALEPDLPLGGIGAGAKLQSFNWVNEYNLHFNRTFNEKHRIRGLAGFSMQGFSSELLSGVSRGFETETLSFYNLSVGQNKAINSNFQEWQMVSAFTRLDYSLDGKYSLSFTGRADGSSRFYGDYEFFPAFSASWRVSEEPFLKNSNAISDLKLRVSYGVSGNSDIPPFSTLSVLQQFEATLDEQAIRGFRPVTLGNNSLEMEKTSQFDFGIDAGLFKDRLGVSLDYYSRMTDNAITYLPVAANSGFEVALANATEVSNKGIDFSISSKNLTGDFKWDTYLTIGFSDNEIKSIEGDKGGVPSGTSLQNITNWSILKQGAAIGSFYGYVSDGIVQSGENPGNIPHFEGQSLEAGDRKYRDLNGDGTINVKDKMIIGSPLPDLSVGFINSFSFKGFDLNIFLQGVSGNDVANFNKFLVENPNGRSNLTNEAFDNRWTSGNPGNEYPRAVLSSSRKNVFSDAQIEDGSYLRLRNITLGYSLPEKLLDKWRLSQLRIYVTGQNLVTLTGYSGVDPDVSHLGQSVLEQGVDFGGYPKAKVYLAGVNIGF